MEPKVARQVKWWSVVVGTFALLLLLYSWQMQGMLTAILVLASVLTVLAILMQSSKGGGLAALGGMGEQTPFGSRAGGPLRYVTYFLAGVFLVCVVLLGRLGRELRSAGPSPAVPPPASSQRQGSTPTKPDFGSSEEPGQGGVPDPAEKDKSE